MGNFTKYMTDISECSVFNSKFLSIIQPIPSPQGKILHTEIESTLKQEGHWPWSAHLRLMFCVQKTSKMGFD